MVFTKELQVVGQILVALALQPCAKLRVPVTKQKINCHKHLQISAQPMVENKQTIGGKENNFTISRCLAYKRLTRTLF